MGASVDPKFKDDVVSHRNKKIIEFFSKPISQVNRQFFTMKLNDKLAPELRPLVQEISDDNTPLVDSFGRTTFFFINLGGIPLPVYQPGSIMFETAIKANSDLSVIHGGSQ